MASMLCVAFGYIPPTALRLSLEGVDCRPPSLCLFTLEIHLKTLYVNAECYHCYHSHTFAVHSQLLNEVVESRVATPFRMSTAPSRVM